jgi:hypothetical protein
MPIAPTYTALQTITLTSSASSVTFSSIPNTYRDLVLSIIPKATVTGPYDAGMQFNADTGGNYSATVSYGNGSTLNVYTALQNVNQIYLDFQGSVQNAFNQNCIAHVFDYAATDKHKGVLSRSNRTNSGLDLISSRWRNTTAINSIKYFLIGGTLDVGTKLSLYGIEG